MGEPVKMMEEMVSLDYAVRTSPVQRRFEEQTQKGRIIGHKCPSCGLVYVPPKGFCPLCPVITTDEHEVEVADQGVVTSFTVITPIQYRGQKERKDYVVASILLEGADSTVGQQRIDGLPHDKVRMGLKVKAVWNAKGKRSGGDSRWGLGNAVKHWVPTGEADADRSEFEKHVL